MSTTATAGTEAQISTAYSLADQLIAVWQKLGGEFGNWSESTIHSLMQQKGVTLTCAGDFTEYTRPQLSRSIGIMIRMLQHYRAKWDAHWRSEAAERERQINDRKRIMKEGMTWSVAERYLVEHGITARQVYEVFRCVGEIDGVTYWILRDKIVTFWTQKEASSFYADREWGGRTFDDVFEFVDEPGVYHALYRPLFTLVPSQEDAR